MPPMAKHPRSRTGDAEEREATTFTCPSPPRMADAAGGKTDQAVGDAAAHHQIAGIDEERNRHHGKAFIRN